ncbi:MAG: glycosyltransferase family 39 protein [Thermodesulfobacteriota bacterium]
MQSKLYLILILLLALFLRCFDLSNNPPELNSDELINFASAHSIVETGADLHGKLLPYFTDKAVEMRPPIYGYATLVSTLIMGENTSSIRAPAVFFGLLSIFAVYLLGMEFFRDRRAALMAAFLMTIVPWHIHFSRVGWEPASFLPFLLFSIYFFLHGVNSSKRTLVALSFALFTLTIYTYHAAPLYAFLFLFSLFLLNFRYFIKEKKLFVICILIAAILAIPYIWTASTEYLMYARAKSINTFKDGLNTESISLFASNYISHFGLEYLFISGDPNLKFVSGAGVLYWIMLPLILFGVIGLWFCDLPRKHKILIVIWILIYPLAGSLTNDGVPHAARTLVGSAMFCLLSGFGYSVIYRFVISHTELTALDYVFSVSIVFISLLSLGYFANFYYFHYPNASYLHWDYGQKQIFSNIQQLEHEYKLACMGNLNHPNNRQLLYYYLRDSKLDITKNLDDSRCRESGTIIVQKHYEPRIDRSMQLVDIVKGPDEKALYHIYVIE